MAKANTATDNRIVRRAPVKWTENSETPGEPEIVDIEVLFYSPTVRELRESAADIEQYFKDHPDEPYYVTNTLFKRLHSIPHFNVGVGQSKPLTLEWLEDQDLKNLNAINEGVKEILNPKS